MMKLHEYCVKINKCGSADKNDRSAYAQVVASLSDLRQSLTEKAGQERRLHSFLDTFILCRDVGPEEIVMQPEEVVDFCWVGQSQYRRMEREGLLHPALKNFFTTYREKIPRGNPFRKHLRR